MRILCPGDAPREPLELGFRGGDVSADIPARKKADMQLKELQQTKRLIHAMRDWLEGQGFHGKVARRIEVVRMHVDYDTGVVSAELGAGDELGVYSNGEFDFDAEDPCPTATERKIEGGFGMDEDGVGTGMERA